MELLKFLHSGSDFIQPSVHSFDMRDANLSLSLPKYMAVKGICHWSVCRVEKCRAENFWCQDIQKLMFPSKMLSGHRQMTVL